MNPRYFSHAHFLMEGEPGGGTGAPPAAPAAPAPSPAAPAAPAAPATWFDGFDADTKGWIQNRGYDKLDATNALSESIKGFRNAEKFLGVPAEQIVRLPGKDAKPEDYNAVYDKLGRPADPAKYELKFGDAQNVDEGFTTFARGLFHKVGLNQNQASQVAAEFGKYTQEAVQKQVAAYQENLAKQEVELKQEQGAQYDAFIGTAKQAINALGIKAEQIDQLEQVMGFAGVMRFFNQLGTKVGEAPFHGQGESGGFGALSKEAAQTEIARLRNDVEFSKKVQAGDAEAKAKWDRLHVVAYG